MRYIEINKLKLKGDKPNPDNIPYQVLKECIQEHGILNPIVITPDLETFYSPKIAIAQDLNMDKIPFIMWPYIEKLCEEIKVQQ